MIEDQKDQTWHGKRKKEEWLKLQILRVQICIAMDAIDGVTMEITYHFLLEFQNFMMTHKRQRLGDFFPFQWC